MFSATMIRLQTIVRVVTALVKMAFAFLVTAARRTGKFARGSAAYLWRVAVRRLGVWRARSVAAGTVAMLVIVGALATAWPNDNHRKSNSICDATAKSCSDQFIEDWGDRWIGFIEITDAGRYHDESKAQAIYRRVGDEAATGDLIIVAYVHGWQHNAHTADGDVVAFRKLVEQLSNLEGARSTQPEAPRRRKVVGIYVGWRGRTVTWPGLENLTFWARKAVAEKVVFTAGNVFDLLSGVWAEGNRGCWDTPSGPRPRSTRLLLVGHSFGGLIVSKTVVPKLTQYLTGPKTTGLPGMMDRYSDLIFLVNPAVEGAQFVTLRQHISEFPRTFTQAPVLVAITSTADWATRFLFPLGRYPSTWTYGVTESEWNDALHTVGHLPSYRTHTAKWSKVNVAPLRPPERFQSEERAYREFEAKHRPNGRLVQRWSRTYSSGVILTDEKKEDEKIVPDTPFWFISTDKSLISGHSDFNERLQSFVGQMFNDVVRRNDARPCS